VDDYSVQPFGVGLAEASQGTGEIGRGRGPASRGHECTLVGWIDLEGELRPGCLSSEGPRGLFALLAPEIKSLDRAPQPVQGCRRLLVPPGRLGELFLGAAPLFKHPRQALVAMLTLQLRLRPMFLDLGETRLDPLELRGGDSPEQAVDLADELLGALRRRRLERERPQTFAHLLLDVAGALDLELDAGELELGAVAALLEGAETGGFLDEGAPLGRLRAQDLLDPALADNRMELGSEAGVGEDLDDVHAPHSRAVDEVLALAAPV
jgi:hypothetical protein